MTATKLATLFAHDDGRHAVWPGVESPPWTHGDPGWHRVGPVDVHAIATPQCLAQIEEPAGAAPAAVAPQGEYPYLPQSVGDVTDFGDGKVDIDWGHPAPVCGASLYSAEQMRAYVDADRAARAAQPTAVAGPAIKVPEDWMEHLGFELDAPADGVWMVIDDTGARREANLTERILWKELIAIRAAIQDAALAPAAPALEAPVVDLGDLVAVPRDLIGSACAAIVQRRAAPKTLAELRRYTTGDLSRHARAAAPQALATDLTDAYTGAREDLTIWKRRALEAERDLRAEREANARLVAEINAASGPTHMGEAAPQAPAAPVDDLAQLVKQLVRALRKAAPGNDLADKALDYLKRQGLQGSPLRTAHEAPPTHVGLLAAAAHIQAKAQAHLDERGSYDPDTGAVEMSESNQEHFNTLDELAEEIRLMADKAAPAPCGKPPQAPATEPVARAIFTNRNKPDVEWLVESVTRGMLLYAAPQAPAAPAENMVRYCPGCGSVGTVESKYRDCCPDGGQARFIPQALAEKCRDTFKLAVDGLVSPQAAPAAPWKDHQTARLVNDLRDCAIKYHGAGQLRERIAHIVVPLCDQLKGALAAPAAPALGRSAAQAVQALQEMWDDLHKSGSPRVNARAMRYYSDALSTVESALLAAPAAPAVDALAPVQALLDVHAALLDANPYAYFELAYTRQTGWMAWITDKPMYGAQLINPDRKVLARGQGDTAAAACAAAAQAKEGGAPVADAAPLDVCTDPYNCARCKTHPAHRGDMHHAGISRIGGSA